MFLKPEFNEIYSSYFVKAEHLSGSMRRQGAQQTAESKATGL